ncbi:response regulator transcription factor [Leifsonia sp. 2MCAF36]|uniref:helix-turn-helix transcriptional regulator n=1 Tax=Leifsonia sp. 2MCAF36 TaxID=3232988 RepID=UPI003F98183E
MSSSEDTNEDTRVDPKRRPHDLPALVTEVATRDGWQAAASVIEQHWDAFAGAAPEQLLAALKALPGEAFVETPGLLVAANYLQQVSIDGDPRRFFHDGRLAPPPSEGNGSTLNTLILLTGQAAGARTAGRLDEARRSAQEARKALRALSPAERAPFVASIPHLRFQWGRTLDATDTPGALAEYEEAYQLARLTKQPVVARRTAGHVAWYHAERGRLRLAELWLARAHAEPATNGRYDVVVFLASTLLRHDQGHPDAAAHLARAFGLPLGEHWAAALWLSAMLEHTKPGAASVHAHLENELERHPEAHDLRGANGRYIKAAEARLARLRPRLRIQRPLPAAPSALDHLLAALSAYQSGRYSDALEHSEAAVAQTVAPRVEAPAQLIAAASHLAFDQTSTAADAFRQANAIVGAERLFSTYSFLPSKTLAELSKVAGEPLHGSGHTIVEHTGLPKLTKREREILDLLRTGMPMSTIAAELFVSPNTIKSTTRTLYRKLGVNSRAAAVATANRGS